MNVVTNSLKPIVRPSVRSSVCLSVCLFVHLSVCPSVRPSGRPAKSPLGRRSWKELSSVLIIELEYFYFNKKIIDFEFLLL